MTDYEKNHKIFLREILVKCPEIPKYNYVENKWGKSQKLHVMFSDWRMNDQVSTCGELNNASLCFIAQLCLTLCDPFDCSPPGSLVHGILRARVLEWVTMPSSRDLPNPGTELTSFVSSVLAGGFFTSSTTWEPHFTSLCTYGELSNAPLSQRYLHPKTCNLKFSFFGGGREILKMWLRILKWGVVLH